jgi:hypothetical protein
MKKSNQLGFLSTFFWPQEVVSEVEKIEKNRD